MAKASLTLPDGTIANIEGSAEEIQKIISLHRPNTLASGSGVEPKKREKKKNDNTESGKTNTNLSDIVTQIKNCDEAEHIEKNILDRTSQIDKILLPLYIGKKYVNEKIVLTSGDISKILGDLSISIFTQNVSNALSGSASKYVIGDKVRKRGQAVYYKLSRRGDQYLESVIQNKAD